MGRGEAVGLPFFVGQCAAQDGEIVPQTMGLK